MVGIITAICSMGSVTDVVCILYCKQNLGPETLKAAVASVLILLKTFFILFTGHTVTTSVCLYIHMGYRMNTS